MIVYFSATGNCKYVAQQVAEATKDRIISFTDINRALVLEAGENLGIITPTYSWRLPSIVEDYMVDIDFQGDRNRYVFYVNTYGTTCGQCGRFMEKLLANKGFTMDASYSVKMPDTWTPIFDLSNQEKLQRIHEAEVPQIAKIIDHIHHKDRGNYMNHQLPMFLVEASKPLFRNMFKTRHFHVEDHCIGCGLCLKNCPIQALELQNHKPVWIKEDCAMCLSCLHHCPKFAIQYGKRTKYHGQYHHP
jgi:NAD-dependent dihydropyrimidine dehydrogenase PreA subunit/flavodoxin